MRLRLTVLLFANLICSAQTLSLSASQWLLFDHPNLFPGSQIKKKNTLTNTQTGALQFSFPSSSTGKYHNYFYTTHGPVSISGLITFTLQVDTTGTPVFNTTPGETCDPYLPSAVHPFFWANNFGVQETDRWWAYGPGTFYNLAAGTATLTIPLTAANWLNVGHTGTADPETTAAFYAALQNVSAIGMTFSGGCSYGHGVNVSGGTAVFNLLSYSVIP